MNFIISDEIFEKYPNLQVGVVIAKNLDNENYNEEIKELIKDIMEQKRQEIDPEKISEIPSIAKWRETYRAFNAKPSKYRNSAEALLKRILKEDLWKINKLVDLYNYISIKHTVTVGGEDLESIEGDLILDFATGDEEFIALGEEKDNPPWEEEVIYKDERGVVCRCWNYREAERTKLTNETKNAIIVIENLLPEENEKLKQATQELEILIKKYCKAETEVQFLDKNNKEIDVDF